MIKAIIALIFLFTIDNIIVIFFPVQSIFVDYTIVPYMLLAGMCIAVFYDEKNYTTWLAVIFGLIYDVYGSNLIGIYTVIFPIIILLMKKYIVPVTPVNFVSIFYAMTVSILAVEIVIYFLVMIIIPTRSLSLHGHINFIQYRLILTLIFNMCLLAVSYWPLVKFLKPKHEKKLKTIMMDNTVS